MKQTAVVAAGILLVCTVSCIDPLVDDEVVPNVEAFSVDTVVPGLETNEDLLAMVDEYDGVGRRIEPVSAFAGGQRIWYWGFGLAADAAIPIFILARKVDGSWVTVDHPPIFDAIPGDQGYTPFWVVRYVPVTDAWNGEKITSLERLQQAETIGLVGAPIEQDVYVNCPVVHPDAVLVYPDGSEQTPATAYYRGLKVPVFSFETLPLDENGAVATSRVLKLRREGGEPLDEGARRVDMTGDGDTNDSNTIFESAPGDDIYSPLWRVYEVVVPAGYQSIDTFGDETQADATAWTHLFNDDWSPKSDKVVAWAPTELYVNCPVWEGN